MFDREIKVVHGQSLRAGELLILTAAGVPQGPPDARAAWASKVGALFEVVIGGGPPDGKAICRSTGGCLPVNAWRELERLDGVPL